LPNTTLEQMSNPASPQTPESSLSTAAQPTGEQPPVSEPPRSLKGAGLRYGASDGVPTWAVGKTADEVLALAQQAVGVLQSASYQQSQPAQPASQGAYSLNVQGNGAGAGANAGAPQAPDPELAYQNPTEYARQYDRYSDWRMQQQLAQVGAPVYQQLADMAREQSRTGAHADVWRRWEPEVEIKLAGIPHASRNRALYDQAAALVKADHVEELARERMEALAGAGAPATERAGTAGGAAAGTGANSAGDPLADAFASGLPFFERAKQNGLTPDRVRQFLASTGQTAEEYIANAKRGTVVVTQEGFVRSHG
jgi:hypothetical protein